MINTFVYLISETIVVYCKKKVMQHMWRDRNIQITSSAFSNPIGFYFLFVLSSRMKSICNVCLGFYVFRIFLSKKFLERLHLNVKIIHICYTLISENTHMNSRHVTDCVFASYCDGGSQDFVCTYLFYSKDWYFWVVFFTFHFIFLCMIRDLNLKKYVSEYLL